MLKLVDEFYEGVFTPFGTKIIITCSVVTFMYISEVRHNDGGSYDGNADDQSVLNSNVQSVATANQNEATSEKSSKYIAS